MSFKKSGKAPITVVSDPQGEKQGTPKKRACFTCGKEGCMPQNHAGWHPDDDKIS